MPTLADENAELRQKVASLEQALGRATFELARSSKRLGAEQEMLFCSDVVVAMTVSSPSDAITFYSTVLGAKEGFRIQDKDGRIAHAALQIGDSQVFINSEYPELGKISPPTAGTGGAGTSVALTVFVDDVGARFQQALRAGCREVVPVRETFWGDQTGTLIDPFGHQWVLSTNRTRLTVSEIRARAAQ